MFTPTTVIHLYPSRVVRRIFTTMAETPKFIGMHDRFNGVTVDSTIEPCKPENFRKQLQASLDKWEKERRRTIWFRIDKSQAHWIPELTRYSFRFHHAKELFVMMYRWLPTDETVNVPPYAHTNIGVGGVVMKEETRELLVVKEKHAQPMWKLPGGYVEPEEDISEAIEREVFEETGIKAKFQCILAMRHGHQHLYNCSDIYFVTYLKPETFKNLEQSREISDCQWMKLDDFLASPTIHSNNKFMANKVLEYLDNRTGFTATRTFHPISLKNITNFHISEESSS